MSDYAITNDGEILDSNLFDDLSWEKLKKEYKVGDFKTICCSSNAIPKTSINFKKFFSHQNDECQTAPETIWHKTAKKMIVEEFLKQDIIAVEEKIGNSWIADVYLEFNNRKIAIELQQSPQTLKVYLERQKKYQEDNIEAIWILFHPRYITISKAIAKYRLKNEFNNKVPKSGYFPSLSHLPVLYIDEQNFRVKGVDLFNYSIENFITSIISNTLVFDRTWKIA
jgi:competence CoiA-like predicted nuclease